MTTQTQINLQLPAAYQQLLTRNNRHRYYVFHGGRGSGKSWSIARCLIILAYSTKHRILCCREYQRSLADSVHLLLVDQIKSLGLSDYFTITQDRIVAKSTGSEFLFRGLHANSDQIKSLEGVTIVWIEEGHACTAESLDYLIPTIRTPGSEIWISFNARDEQDEIYQRFVLHTPSDAYVRQVNWYDNPYFPDVLKAEMLHCKETDPDRYNNVWLGAPRTISDAQIFANKYKIKDFVTPDDAEFMYGADFGFSRDANTLIRCWDRQDGSERNLYVDWELYQLHTPIEQLPAAWMSVPGSNMYRVNCDCSRPETIHHLQTHGFPLAIGEPKLKIEDGLSYLLGYHNIYIHTRCPHVTEEMRMYSYKLDGSGNPTRTPEDKNNHCFTGDTLVLTEQGYKQIQDITIADRVLTREGYQRVLKVWRNGVKTVRRYNILGHTIIATPDHNVITTSGKIKIDDLTSNHYIYIWSDLLCRYIRTKNRRLSYIKAVVTAAIQIAREEAIEYISDVLTSATPGIFISQYMRTTTAKSRKGIIYTIKTKIRSIMISTISNSFLLPIILAVIVKSFISKIGNTLKYIWRKYNLSRQSGTEAKPGESGIDNILRNIQEYLLSVSIVAKSTKYKRPGIINFALIIASRPLVVLSASITLPLFVLYAVKSLLITNTISDKSAPLPVEADCLVYDLYIENQHEYFANGVLVSNCIDALRYALYYRIVNSVSRVISTHSSSFTW